MLGWPEIESRAVRFQKQWKDNPGGERQDAQTFEKDLMNVFGIDFREGLHEHQITLKDGSIRYIDYLLPGKILIEMKSKDKSLMVAYSQAMRYVQSLKPEEVPQLVMVSDFNKIEVHNLEKGHKYKPFKVTQLKSKVRIFGVVAGYGSSDEVKTEIELNTDASYKMAELHDSLKENGYTGHNLEVYLVRLLFCMFADDTGIFEKGDFEKYISNSSKDGTDLSMKLMTLFSILNNPPENRMTNLPTDLKKFRYVNGSLFKESLPPAFFDHKMREVLLECCQFDWSQISPTIFGAMFQGVMDQDERRTLGAHYTSEENILKVLRPLFLDELYNEFERSKNTTAELNEFHDKIASLKFLDPACGSGNFLILSYQKLREIEFEILKYLYDGGSIQQLGMIDIYSKVSVDQFYGIEIDEFACEVAKLSMLLIKHLMDQEVSNHFGMNIIDFPIKENANIIHGNALELDWKDIASPVDLNYILGNPPFIGARLMNKDQTGDFKRVFGKLKGIGNLDYVSGWYYKAAEYIMATGIRTAFVSTNSITQGEQVAILWKLIIEDMKMEMDFGYETFKWSNEARGKAAVHCVIIGYSDMIFGYKGEKNIYKTDGTKTVARNINGYLKDAPNVYIESRRKPICNTSDMKFGSMPNDGGFLILSTEEREQMIKEYPNADKFIKPFVGAREFINNIERWCLWITVNDLKDVSKIKLIMNRIQEVQNIRIQSNRKSTRDLAEIPYSFGEIRQPDTRYLLVPRVSSENRRYIPIGYMDRNTIASDAVLIVPEATLYQFSILSSNVHMAWTRTVGGRLKSDYRYSASIVYNNFPWPNLGDEEKEKLSETGQMILDVRAKYPDWTYADLYNTLIMPPDLRKAHIENDRTVWEIYGRPWDIKSEEKCIEHLMNMYAELIDN